MNASLRTSLAGALFLVTSAASASVRAQETGRIVGRVVDSELGRPVATVQVFIPGTPHGVLSDLDGRFRLAGVPAGTHDVAASLIGYTRKTVTGVVVRAGGTTTLDISLAPAAIEVEEITVTATLERGNTALLLTERRRSSIVQDAIGSAQIGNSPDGDAAAALQRVPGLSVVDGRYVFVRGLGERYGNTILNGAPLPSAEPDKKAVALDVIPSDLVETLVTAKTYSPDQPGDYAGGLVKITTKEFPARRVFKLKLGASVHTNATWADGLGYEGGGLDYFGFDDGTRALPDEVPADVRVQVGDALGAADVERIGEGFATEAWGPTSTTLPVNSSFGFTYGDELTLGGAPFGFLATVNHGVEQSHVDDRVERVFATAGAADPEVDYRGILSTQTVSSGALLSLNYRVTPTSKVSLSTLYNRLVDDESRVFEGFNLDSNADQRNFRLRYVARSLFNASLEGEHLLTWLAGTNLSWRLAYSRAGRYEPNTREVLYRQGPDGRFLFETFIQSGSIFHQDLAERGFSGALAATVPFCFRSRPASFGFGGSLDDRDRDVFTRRFRFLPAPGAVIDADTRALPPNQLFTPELIGPGGFQVEEATFRTDNYDAVYRVSAGYGMVELELLPRLRIQGGARIERAEQRVTPLDLFPLPLPPVAGADLDDTDVLPAVNLTYVLGSSMNLRVGVSQTVARPQLRELAPFSFADYAGGYLAAGNPELRRTLVQNYDVRWEWFAGPTSVLAVSGFHKRFDDPIETLVFPSSELIQSWVNADEAENFGLEIEVRSGLGPIAHALRNFSLNANLTLVDSEVTTGGTVDIFVPGSGPTQLTVLEKTRSLQGQSPYVVNVGVGFASAAAGLKATTLYNRFGRRIDSVGGESLEDVFEEDRGTLDLVLEKRLPWDVDLKLAVSRLLGNEVEFTQFGDVLRSYDLGRKLSLSLSWGPGGL